MADGSLRLPPPRLVGGSTQSLGDKSCHGWAQVGMARTVAHEPTN